MGTANTIQIPKPGLRDNSPKDKRFRARAVRSEFLAISH